MAAARRSRIEVPATARWTASKRRAAMIRAIMAVRAEPLRECVPQTRELSPMQFVVAGHVAKRRCRATDALPAALRSLRLLGAAELPASLSPGCGRGFRYRF